MSTVCCLTMPSNHHDHPLPLSSSAFALSSDDNRIEKEKEVEMEEGNYSIILNQQNLPSMTTSRYLQQQQEPLLLVAEEAELVDNDNDKLLLPRSTRSLKRRVSLFEKSRDWVKYFSEIIKPIFSKIPSS